MSTLSRDYEYGRIVSVDVITLGDNLAADAAMSDTTITVEDAADFDEDGGSLLLNDVVYTYTACDDDTGIISGLDPVLAAAAVEGDDVSVYDPLYKTAQTDKVAQVAVIGDDGAVDMLECAIALHLVDSLEEGVRGGKGESVKIELDGGEWLVVDIRGLSDPATGPGGGDKFKIDPFVVAAPGAQALALTHVPLPESHHLYWNGEEQEGAYTIDGQTAVIDSTEGATLEVGDDLVVKYAYRIGPDLSTPANPLDIPGMLIWYSSDYPSHPGPISVGDWQDLSGNNYHAVAEPFGGGMPQWLPTSGPDFGPTIRFHTGYFALPQAPFDGLTEAECWFVVKADAEQTLASFHQLTGSGDFQHYNDPTSYWQEQWGSTTRRAMGPPLAVANWKRINFWTAPNDWACNVGGANVVHEVLSNTVGFGAIGNIYEIGIGYTPAGSFPGTVACFLMWDHKLTTTERAQVEAYLTANPSGGRP